MYCSRSTATGGMLGYAELFRDSLCDRLVEVQSCHVAWPGFL